MWTRREIYAKFAVSLTLRRSEISFRKLSLRSQSCLRIKWFRSECKSSTIALFLLMIRINWTSIWSIMSTYVSMNRSNFKSWTCENTKWFSNSLDWMMSISISIDENKRERIVTQMSRRRRNQKLSSVSLMSLRNWRYSQLKKKMRRMSSCLINCFRQIRYHNTRIKRERNVKFFNQKRRRSLLL